jgi:hypothetical protein
MVGFKLYILFIPYLLYNLYIYCASPFEEGSNVIIIEVDLRSLVAIANLSTRLNALLTCSNVPASGCVFRN